MNFLDPYDMAGTGATTPTPNQEAQEPEPSLNEEVTQVIGQLGRFWGGFRKQSQLAFESAKKDLGQVVTQAQKELGKLATEAPASTSGSATASSDTSEAITETTSEARDVSPPAAAETQARTSHKASPNSQATPPQSPVQTFFSRIQSSLPPTISSTLQKNLPGALASPSGVHVDFAQIRATLNTEFQRVQGVTRAQAEEYVQKSEALFKDAGTFLKDAVKVVPPEDGDTGSAGVMWDGSDVWVMSSPVGTLGWGGAGKGKGRDLAADDAAGLLQQQRAAGTRADALLQRLKRDPEMIRLDPQADESVNGLYEQWVKDHLDVKESGLAGSFWSEKIRSVLEAKPDGEALTATKDALVPYNMDEKTFWTRYFFRIHQIEQEEEKRKALLAGAAQNDEDFSWEDDEDDNTNMTPSAPCKEPASPAECDITDAEESPAQSNPTTTSHLPVIAEDSAPSSLVVTPATMSPRASEDGYDLVSSGNVTSAEIKVSVTKSGEAVDADDDSDWE